MNPTLNCPKCNGTMEEGFSLDSGHYSIPAQSQWLEGKPERSFWTGLVTKNRQLLAVITYRCEACGFLESYARDEGQDAA